jgi:hypothetical protein
MVLSINFSWKTLGHLDRQSLKHGVANIVSLAETYQKIIRDQMKTGVSLDNRRMARECSKRFLSWWQASD